MEEGKDFSGAVRTQICNCSSWLNLITDVESLLNMAMRQAGYRITVRRSSRPWTTGDGESRGSGGAFALP